MTSVEVSDELYERLSAITGDLSEFETTEELVAFALETVATDLEQTAASDDATVPPADRDSASHSEDDEAANADDAVEERLGDLGYL